MLLFGDNRSLTVTINLRQEILVKEFADFARKAWKVLEPFHKPLMVMLGLLAAAEALMLVSPYLLGMVINGMQEGISMRNAFLVAMLSLCVSLVVILVFHAKGVYEIMKLDDVLDADLEDKTLKKVQSLSIGQHLSQHSGITTNVVNTGRQSLLQLVQLTIFNILPIATRVVITVGALLWFNLLVGSVVLLTLSGTIWFSLNMNKKFMVRINAWRDVAHRNGKFRHEILKNLGLIQVQAQESRVRAEFKTQLDGNVETGQGIWSQYMRYASFRELLITLVRYCVLFIGIFLVFQRGFLVGDFVILWAWTNQATAGVDSISHLQRQWMRMSTEVRKYLALLEIKPAVVVVPNPIKPSSLRGEIEFKDVTFSYRHQEYIDVGEKKLVEPVGEPALRGISFRIRPGERVAFVGESGAGKSTIINLLVRAFDPDEGQILVDGHDLRLLDLKHFRESIGLVEQKVELFDQTLRYNVLFGLNGRGQYITDEDLDVVARTSRISQFNHRLTNGWETWLGENGVKLSGGERQRVGIARALVKKSSILILDEATSSLDAKNERLIKEAVQDASAGRTTIIIAHRLSTVRDADRIYVMDRGRIVDYGTHDELHETSGIYRELVQSQLVRA